MLDYDKEAGDYDALRGGEPRAEAAARAVLGLVPEGTRRLLDIACGTGIVTRRFAAARDGMRVTGVDLTYAMASRAAARLPGSVVIGDGRRLPFRDGQFDAVTSVWLLHLLRGPDDVRAVVGECARVLRPGGVYVTTVDKGASHNVGSDIDAVLARRPRAPATDPSAAVEKYADEHGLRTAGQARFPGRGQGRSPAGPSPTCAAAGSSPCRPATRSPMTSRYGSPPCPTRTGRARTRSSRCGRSARHEGGRPVRTPSSA